MRAADRVSYDVDEGDVLAIVGESGSGKTVLNMAPLGLLPSGVTVDLSGSVTFAGRDLLTLEESELRGIRGGEVGVVFQDPLSSLNPVRRIGPQVAEVVELHLGVTARRGGETGGRAAVPGGNSGPRAEAAAVSARALGRHAAEGRHRDEHRRRAEAADRRRADDGPGRHRAGPDRERAQGAAGPAGNGDRPHHPRHRGRVGDGELTWR